ncbi:MAG: transcription termination factor Rho [Chthoniobacterales bacterium]|nr:transcription termination factor Rho [Chthoniobacterales bacterium]
MKSATATTQPNQSLACLPSDASQVAGAALDLDLLQALSHAQLAELLARYSMRVRPDGTKRHLVFDLCRFYLAGGASISCRGMIEDVGDHAMLRWPRYNFAAGPDDVFVSIGLVRDHGLQTGLEISGVLRTPGDRDRYCGLAAITDIERVPLAEWKPPIPFDKLTPLFPQERILLEPVKDPALTTRAVDLIAPLGKGQRALIVAPPRTGKTILMKDMAQAIRATSPDVRLILLLVDERPEEVTDLRRSIDADIYSSTFDESPQRHTQLAEFVIERAKRLVEQRRDVVILLDSITRLARGFNNLQPGKGRIMSGGVDTKALMKPKKFFGAARNTEEGGSLTIVATALIETQSRMDDLIFEEFKGTGNMEIHLDRTIADQRIFPAIHVTKSATRREENLYHPDELSRVVVLRKQLNELPAVEAMETLVRNLQRTKTNAELLLGGLR